MFTHTNHLNQQEDEDLDDILHSEPGRVAPSRASRILRAADARVRRHMEEQRGHSRGFIASDFRLVNAALERVVDERLARGPLFCEWGSGLGVVAMLASLLGFEAYGIEIQGELVQAAEEFADAMNCDVCFAQGSFLTACDDDLIESQGYEWHTTDSNAYDDLDLEPCDFDVFFVYPWPGEETLFESLFMRYASVGALLMTYHDTSGVLVQRKTQASGKPTMLGWY